MDSHNTPQATASRRSNSLPSAAKPQPLPCESCERSDCMTWLCQQCGTTFCNDCWARQISHKPGKTGLDGMPHEKADRGIVTRLAEILAPPANALEQHLDDEDSTWFGVDRDEYGGPVFRDYGQYATLIGETASAGFRARYPRLVSFVGQTGSGKSTLVKTLVDQQARDVDQSWQSTYPSPVVGSPTNDYTPTSADVHLYVDPATCTSQFPMLYADCEGLDGGEQLPVSSQYCNPHLGRSSGRSDANKSKRRGAAAKLTRGSQRALNWADSPEKQKRQYAVTELYPRLLYTFSDVIVFVVRNAKTFESAVLSKLLDWALVSLEKSINQPMLPHAIIALNATDMGINHQEWDPEYATTRLIDAMGGTIDRVSDYRPHVKYWRSNGRDVVTLADLLKCYYSSFTVVRIPVKSHYMRVEKQVRLLYANIVDRCEESYMMKRRSSMLSNANELNVYLQSAFDHFTQDLGSPFNFVDVACRMNSVPSNLGGNIIHLAVAFRKHRRDLDEAGLFRELVPIVASCIMLDSARQGLKGAADQLLEKAYIDQCNYALEEFGAMFVPCSFSNKKGRCCAIREGHVKGHQNDDGKIIGDGRYQSTFDAEKFGPEWSRLLTREVLRIQKRLQERVLVTPQASDRYLICTMHRDTLRRFYQSPKDARKFICHLACFCCLRGLPEHPLPCGHVLCSPCVKEYGMEVDNVVFLSCCPLHPHESFPGNPWPVHFKPALAGVRILSLDGGGMRGIVELEILRAIEVELGDEIPVQDFFDLIVGTSTGGLISIALGIEHWSVETLLTRYPGIMMRAFTRKVSLTLRRGKYRTHPLVEVLNQYFKNNHIFGGEINTPKSYASKVAVTSATETGNDAVIFTNYNRLDYAHLNYTLKRPSDPSHELKLWEAACATSAAPPYFRPFVNERTNEGFLDGALFHNNPVRIAASESQLLWPDVKASPPDILLSLGTGHCTSDPAAAAAADAAAAEDSMRSASWAGKQAQPQDHQPKAPRSLLYRIPGLTRWLDIVFNRVDSLLDGELMWRSFCSDNHLAGTDARSLAYQRLNIFFAAPLPKLDETSHFAEFHAQVTKQLNQVHMKAKVARVARCLVASSFYFEKQGPSKEFGSLLICQGYIRCKFANGSENVRRLGRYLMKHQTPAFQPYFAIYRQGNRASARQLQITRSVVQSMVNIAAFDLDMFTLPEALRQDPIHIELALRSGRNSATEFHPISGFPRLIPGNEDAHLPLSPPESEFEQLEPFGPRHSRSVTLKDSASVAGTETGNETEDTSSQKKA